MYRPTWTAPLAACAERVAESDSAHTDRPLVSVVIPVYNECSTLAEVVRRVAECGLEPEIIVVDDGSSDGTQQVLTQLAEQAGVRVVRHDRNQGKGAALRTGFALARGSVVVVQDADLEYDPDELARLVEPILADEADVVFGSRFAGPERPRQSVAHYLVNRLLTGLSNCFTRLKLTDMETCYKVFRRDVLAEIAPRLRENRFAIEPEITARLARIPGIRIVEQPISYAGRSYAQGKKIGWRDALSAVWCIVRCGLARRT